MINRTGEYFNAIKGIGLPGMAILLFIFIYPFSVKISLAFLTIYFVSTLQSNYSGFNLNRGKISWLIAGCIIFYLLHVISLPYSENLKHGIKDIETKFGIFIFPLLALFFPRAEKQQAFFIKAFIYAFTFVSVICFLRSLYFCIESSDVSFLFYDLFSYLMHPTYFTMHLALALIFHLYLCLADKNESNYCKTALQSNSITTILLVAIFLTSSRAGIIITLFCVFLLLAGIVVKLNSSPVKTFRVVSLVSIVMFIVLFAGSPRFGILLKELTGRATPENGSVSAPVDENPVAHRFLLMKVAFKIAMKHPLGVGVGDVQDVLVAEYKKIGYEKAFLVRYNPHNQYLQTAVALGLPGFLMLLVIFGSMLLQAGNPGYQKLLFFLGILLIVNGIFESVLEVQRGVLLMTVIIAFLSRTEYSNKILKHSA